MPRADPTPPDPGGVRQTLAVIRRRVPTTLRCHALAVAWFAAVFAASVAPLPAGGEGTFAPANADLVVHGLSYGVLAFLLGRGSSARSGRTLLLVVLVATVLGGAVEIAQVATATRTGAVSDGVANAVGAILGAGAWWICSSRRDPSPRENDVSRIKAEKR